MTNLTVGAEEEGVSVMQQVVNVTSGDNVAYRRFFEASCEGKSCDLSELTIHKGYANHLLLMISDDRLVPGYKMAPITLTATATGLVDG